MRSILSWDLVKFLELRQGMEFILRSVFNFRLGNILLLEVVRNVGLGV